MTRKNLQPIMNAQKIAGQSGRLFYVLELPPFDEYIAMYEEIRTMTEKYQNILAAKKDAVNSFQ